MIDSALFSMFTALFEYLVWGVLVGWAIIGVIAVVGAVKCMRETRRHQAETAILEQFPDVERDR